MQPEKDFLYAQLEEDGRLVLPSELVARYGMRIGDQLQFHDGIDGLNIRRPSRLAKLYIEPTNQCNLECRTCIRNIWDEPMGKLSYAVFARIIEGLRDFSPPPTIFFSGFGEPLFHPEIIRMVSEVKALGAPVELITNATLLTPDLSRELIGAGLDRLWVSIDGATPESYADIRLGAALPQVLENLAHFRDAVYATAAANRRYTCSPFVPLNSYTSLGIVFVAMKRNITDLPEVVKIGKRFGADRFLVTNVLPYSREMVDEALYFHGLGNSDYGHLSLPRMDVSEVNYTLIDQTLRNVYGPFGGINAEKERERCPFMASGAGAISWDGSLSPCLPLLHNYTSYHNTEHYKERISRQWAIGNVMEHSLIDLWDMPEHIAFRERVQAFHFSPCTTCGGCYLLMENEEDCFGNIHPTCGGCLWAQGVIQCP